MERTEVSRLRSFGQLLEFEAHRSVDLLKAIDDTIYACCVQRDSLDHLSGLSAEFVQHLKRVEKPVDADGTILRKLEDARDAIARAYDIHQRKREAAARAPELTPDDGVVEAYDSLLDSLAAAHNITNELCWALGEHDADFDEIVDGEFTSADDLIGALRG
ncbi:hypothetical protein CR3_1071 [Cupriavidus gilardii CR3]|uniref:Uncharacterized protein n=1 Tax=Cupriavidus gilardii TaxID=82541 RepID=A0A849BJJ2_9BURK|nr:hypothetical protein [Cupriavidus gilardii]ALD90312.1 hypothetical protein CR3_1071 [Cupriavidus gilardii CR3]KAB0592767.1 hypothetical protein F7Q96_26125 [Cupriavidus gilardii]MCT9017137.1 hypothetical protein [Cupriavidus gilardii]MCT9056806.1 hypothetical protein [Cupriavidus gilardii]NNH14314.1 hypothetical protein [Cupriavidus gilardii]